MKKRNINPKGFTLVELVVTAVVAVIFILGIGYTLVDNHRSWHAMFNRVYSEVITDGHVARRMFDVFVRKSRAKNILLDENGSWVEVYYYGSPASTQLDRYARFYQSGDKLDLECGTWYPGKVNPKLSVAGVEPRHERAAAGQAQRAPGVHARESQAFGGHPVQPVNDYLKSSASIAQLPTMRKNITRIMRKLGIT